MFNVSMYYILFYVFHFMHCHSLLLFILQYTISDTLVFYIHMHEICCCCGTFLRSFGFALIFSWEKREPFFVLLCSTLARNTQIVE